MANVRKRVEAAILEKLRNGELKPGDRISHPQLAQELGVSSNPVVHAFRRLEGIGVLEHTSSGSTRVAVRSMREIFAYFQIRETTEGLAARFCARLCSDEELAILNVRLEKLEESIRLNKVDEEAEENFHGGIVEFSHTPFLKAEHEKLRLVDLTIAAYLQEMGDDPSAIPDDPGHRPIMEAINRRDDVEAERLMRAHLSAHTRKLDLKKLEETR